MNIQDWFLLGLTGLILSKGLKSLLQHHSSKASILQQLAFFYGSTLTSRHAAAAKSCQSCPTLYDPTDGTPPGSAIPGILQASMLEWVAISFSSAWKWKVKVKSLSCVQRLATPWTAAYQAPPSMGFSRQDWSGVPLPSPKRVTTTFNFPRIFNI